MYSVSGDNRSLCIHTLDRLSAEKLRFVLICTTTRHKSHSSQTERQIRIRVQLILLYDTKHRLRYNSGELQQAFKHLKERCCYWGTDRPRLNHVLTHFRQIYKTVNTDIQAK